MEKEQFYNLAKQLALTLNVFKSYPENHPQIVKILEDTETQLKKDMKGEPLHIFLFKDYLLIGDEKIEPESYPEVQSFLRQLLNRGINSISIYPDFSLEDLHTVFNTLVLERKKIEEFGDIKTYLESKNVKKITVNTANFRSANVSTGDLSAVTQEEFIRKISMDIHSINDLFKKIDETMNQIIQLPEEEGERISRYLVNFIKKTEEYIRNKKGNIEVVSKNINEIIEKRIKNLENSKIKNVFVEAEIIKEKEQSIGELEVVMKGFAKDLGSGPSETEVKIEVKEKGVLELVQPIITSLNSDRKEIRMDAIKKIGEFLEGMVKKGNENVIRYILSEIKHRIKEESEIDVYFSYVELLERISKQLSENNLLGLNGELNQMFSLELSESYKKEKLTIALGSPETEEGFYTLFSLIWNPNMEKIVKDVLKGTNKEKTIPAVVNIFLDSADPAFSSKLFDILLSFGRDALPYIHPILESKDMVIRSWGIKLLQNAGEYEKIAEFIKDPNPVVHRQALNALMELETNEEIIKVLREHFYSITGPDQLKVLEFLVKKGQVDILLELLENEDIYINIPLLKKVITLAGIYGVDEAKEKLKRVVLERSFRKFRFSEDTRMAAVYAFARIGGEGVREFLQSLENDPEKGVRVAATNSLKRLLNA